jgi:hypothetical protein
VGLACLKGMGQQIGYHPCMWIASLAGFRGTVLAEIGQACAGLCRPEGCGLVEIVNVCPSRLGRPEGLSLVVIAGV